MRSSIAYGVRSTTHQPITSKLYTQIGIYTDSNAIKSNFVSRSSGILHNIRLNRTSGVTIDWDYDLQQSQPTAEEYSIAVQIALQSIRESITTTTLIQNSSHISTFPSIDQTSQIPTIDVVHEALRLNIHQVSELLENKEITSVELTRACLTQIEATKSLNIYLSIRPDEALEAAKQADERIQQGKRLSFLDGIPVSLKDNFNLLNSPTTAASKILQNFISPYDSTIASRLKDAGAIIIGKTNLDEFGMGSYTANSGYGVTMNPLQQSVPTTSGGSSGGSSAALAAYTCYLSIGSDTGGSVRLPAAFTGTYGFKPTYGVLSRWGLIAYASSLDCPGILARSTEDISATLPLLRGPDYLDSTCVIDPKFHLQSNSTLTSMIGQDKSMPLRGIRIGIPQELIFEELTQDVLESWDLTAQKLQNLGAEIYNISIPSLDNAIAAYYVIAPSEAVSNLSRFDGVRYGPSTYIADDAKFGADKIENSDSSENIDNIQTSQGRSPLLELYAANRSQFFGPEVCKRIMLGNFALSNEKHSAFALKAMEIRGQIIEEIHNVLTSSVSVDNAEDSQKVHFMLFPTSKDAAPSFKYIEERGVTDPMGAYIDDILTVFANLAGLPALSIPSGTTNVMQSEESTKIAMPIGLQIMGAPVSDDAVLKVGTLLEQTMKNSDNIISLQH